MPQNTKAKPKQVQPAPQREILTPAEEQLAHALATIARRAGARFVRRATTA